MFLFAALLLASATNKIFAKDVNVTPAVMQTFESEFLNVSDVQWSVVDHLYKAEFKEDGEETIAFFNPDGSLVARCQYLSISDLPRAMQRSLKADAAFDNVTEIFEVQNDAGADYYVTVKKGSETKIIKAVANKWIEYKK